MLFVCVCCVFFLMKRRPPRYTQSRSSASSDVYKRQELLAGLLENLVSNAIRYTPEGGEVELRVEPGAPGEVRFKVRDTGLGIPEEEQGKLFQEFYRAPNAKRHCPAGTGLGLALVKQTVCLLYTSPSPRDRTRPRMPSSA